MKKTIKISFVFILFFIAGAAFADSLVPILSNPTVHFFKIQPNDVSVELLTMLFGKMGGLLHGSPGVLGAMFRHFNEAMLILNVMVVGYTVVTGVLNTAQEGEFLGRNASSLWIPIRSVLGIGLLIPTASGYCLLQIMMMWVVLQGVGAADTVWQTAVDTVNHTGYSIVDFKDTKKAEALPWYYEFIQNSLWIKTGAGAGADGGTPSQARQAIIKGWGIGASHWDAALSVQATKLSAELLQAQLCVMKSYQNNGANEFGVPIKIKFLKSVVANQTVYKFPYYTGVKENTEINEYNPKGCGVLKYDNPALHTDSTKGAYYTVRALDAVIPSMVSTLGVAARQAANCVTVPTYSCVSGKPLSTMSNTFITKLKAARKSYIASNPPGAYTNTLKTAVQKGWAVAGAYYKYVASSNNELASMLTTDKFITFNTSAFYKHSGGAFASLESHLTKQPPPGTSSNIGDDLITWLNSMMAYGHNFSFVDYISVPLTVVGNAVTAMFIDIVTGHSPQQIDSGVLFANTKDPISNIQSFGWHIVSLVDVVFSILIWLMATVLAVTTIPCISLTMFGMIAAFILKVMSLIMMALGALYIMGLMMYIYIPLIPYLIFFFGVLGWLIAVVETMLAAPLVAIGIAYPEGHQMLGRADPAVMLVTNVFIRPTLMVFGFIAGIILSYVAVTLLNETFEFVLLTSTHQAMNVHNPMSPTKHQSFLYGRWGNVLRLQPGTGPAVTISFLIIYLSTVMVVINKCFALIHILPDSVLRWIGGQHQFGEYAKGESEVAGQAKSGVGEAAHITKAGASISGDAAKGAAAAGSSFNADDGNADKAGENIAGSGSDDESPT